MTDQNTATPPEDNFEEFARATGLADLFDLGDEAFSQTDDILGSEDPDGDGILLAYRERTAEDGEAVGTVALSTYGPSSTVLLGANGMEELSAWLTARAARARSLALEQGL